MKKILSTSIITAVLCFGGMICSMTTAYAQTQQDSVNASVAQTQQGSANATAAQTKQDFFKARIIHITNESQPVGDDGIKTYIQSYELQPLDGKWLNRKITISDSEFNTVGLDAFKTGDVMLIAHTIDDQGQDQFYVVDYVRESAIYILVFLFVALVIFIGRMKGVKALISLGVSFMVIVWFILPQIVHGADPVLISVIGAIIITVLSLYITYGFKYFTHVGAISIGISLIFTLFITEIFTAWTKLTGNVDEQATNILQILGTNFNLKGLLLASFIIGAIGVLNDVVINQVSLIEELHRADPKMSTHKLFQRGLKVGVDHISAIVNTLFLAYVGASLPLLLLFSADQFSKYDYSTIMNLEIIATEIVRTLTGSVGLILAVPISTFIATIFIPKYLHKHKNLLTNKQHSLHVHPHHDTNQ